MEVSALRVRQFVKDNPGCTTADIRGFFGSRITIDQLEGYAAELEANGLALHRTLVPNPGGGRPAWRWSAEPKEEEAPENDCHHLFHHWQTGEEREALIKRLDYFRSIDDLQGMQVVLIQLTGECDARTKRQEEARREKEILAEYQRATERFYDPDDDTEEDEEEDITLEVLEEMLKDAMAQKDDESVRKILGWIEDRKRNGNAG